MGEVNWTAVVAAISPVSAILVAWMALGRNQRHDAQKDAATLSGIQSDIGYIKSGNDQIKGQLHELTGQINDIRERVAGIEASVKQAHLRIDHLEAGSRDGQ